MNTSLSSSGFTSRPQYGGAEARLGDTRGSREVASVAEPVVVGHREVRGARLILRTRHDPIEPRQCLSQKDIPVFERASIDVPYLVELGIDRIRELTEDRPVVDSLGDL